MRYAASYTERIKNLQQKKQFMADKKIARVPKKIAFEYTRPTMKRKCY
jgi:hypothetical protein